MINNLATGLAWDCALTRAAREPGEWSAEIRPLANGDNETIHVTLTPPGRRATVFAGTMLTFTSWAYMHDVGYARAEITLEAAAFRPLEEKDYDEFGKLVASFTFSDYATDPIGSAPGRVQAIIPYEKEGKDKTLEVDASFGFARPGVWLLRRCHSEFHGGGVSTGEVALVPANPRYFAPIESLLSRMKRTETLLVKLDAAPEDRTTVPLKMNEETEAWVKLKVTSPSDTGAPYPVHTIAASSYRAESLAGGLRLTLGLLSNAYWKEYSVQLKARLLDASGKLLGESSAKTLVRAEDALSRVSTHLDFPAALDPSSVRSVELSLTSGTLTAMNTGSDWWRIKP
jgi:hypothetical protein